MKLDTEFTARIQKESGKGGWAYVVMPGSANSSAPVVVKGVGDEVTVVLLERLPR